MHFNASDIYTFPMRFNDYREKEWHLGQTKGSEFILYSSFLEGFDERKGREKYFNYIII